LIERSSKGLLGAVKAMGIVKELMEIWPNEVCDTLSVGKRGTSVESVPYGKGQRKRGS